jgi:hypothetical protein
MAARNRLIYRNHILQSSPKIMTPASNHERHLADAQAVMDAALRAKSPQERIAIVDGMWRSARAIIIAGLRSDHPDWSDAQIEHAASRRLSHGAI